MPVLSCLICGECGVNFWADKVFVKQKDGQKIFCPNGHGLTLKALADVAPTVDKPEPRKGFWATLHDYLVNA